MAPGSPVTTMLGEYATPENVEKFEKILGLDQPIYIQYFLYVGRLLGGDWGKSIITGQLSNEAVLPIVLRRFMATLQLTVAGMLIASIAGVGLGILSAMNNGRKIDEVIRVLSLIGYSLPIFWFGTIILIIFSVNLRWFPSGGSGGIQNLVLPAVCVGIWCFGLIARVTRASVLEVTTQDFVRTAKAKGLPRRTIWFRHILRNSLIPILTIITLQLGTLLGGAIITETVFNYPGLGSLILDSIYARDYPLVQGALLFSGLLICLVNLVIDILYTYIDPRIRYEVHK
jgi:peptide/nickel transport system permease protein/oligopeptide transport system permease protein